MEIMHWVFFGPSKLIAMWSPTGFVIGLGLILAQIAMCPSISKIADRQLLRKAPILAGLMWWIFNLYEWQVAAVWGRAAGETTLFRVDLQVLTPLLYVLSGFALFSFFASTRPNLGKDA